MLLSPWFWADVVLSVSGGVVVWWGLRVEKSGERMLPPSDFRPDIFGDIVEKAEARIERGWRILIAGIIIEVVAALGISVISGWEIAALSIQADSANATAKLAEKDAADARERTSSNELALSVANSNNLVLRKQMIALEAKQTRIITPEQHDEFIKILKSSPKAPVKVYVGEEDAETRNYAAQIRSLLDDAGYGTHKKNDLISNPSWGYTSPIGDVGAKKPLFFLFYGQKDQVIKWPSVTITPFPRKKGEIVSYYSNMVEFVPIIVWEAFKKIGIVPGYGSRTNWLDFKTNGDWGIFVPERF